MKIQTPKKALTQSIQNAIEALSFRNLNIGDLSANESAKKYRAHIIQSQTQIFVELKENALNHFDLFLRLAIEKIIVEQQYFNKKAFVINKIGGNEIDF